MQSAKNNLPFHWVAEYKDGSVVTEKQVSYVKLRRDELVAFGLFTINDVPAVIVNLIVEKGRTLFYRMRVMQNLSGISSRIYMLGYRTATATYLVVLNEDGKAKTYSSFQEAKLAELEWFSEEQVPTTHD